MTPTKEEILRNLEAAFDICSKENTKVPTVLDIFSQAGYSSSDRWEIRSLFNVKFDEDVIRQIENFLVYQEPGGDFRNKSVRRQAAAKNTHHTFSPQTTVSQEQKVNPTPSGNALYNRIQSLLAFLNTELYEKEKAVRLALLAAIAGENIFLLGAPGTAKSMIAHRLSAVFKHSTTKQPDQETAPVIPFFEYLLNEFTTPDELFGPVSLKELNNDKYMRKTAGFLPTAEVAFLDEIWKAGPAILNTLLTIINEKKFHNGNTVEPVPLKVLVTASNELPANNKGLEALWDRFIVRIMVDPIDPKNTAAFFAMTSQRPDSESHFPPDEAVKNKLLTFTEIQTWQDAIAAVEIPEHIQHFIMEVRQELEVLNAKKETANEKYYVSDRRWKHILHLVRTSAYLHGRKQADIMDATLIADCIWNTEAQREEVTGIIAKAVVLHSSPESTELRRIQTKLQNFTDAVNNTWYDAHPVPATPAAPVTTQHDNKICYEATGPDDKDYYLEVPSGNQGFITKYMKDSGTSKKVRIESAPEDKKTLVLDNDGTYTLRWNEARDFTTEFTRKASRFDDHEVYQKYREEFEAKYYLPLAKSISEKQRQVKGHLEKQIAQYAQHLFAEPYYAMVAEEALKHTLKELEDIELNISKEKKRYEK